MLISIGKPTQSDSSGDPVDFLLECHQRIRAFVELAGEAARRDNLKGSDVVDACQRCERYFREGLPLHVEDEEIDVLPGLKGLSAEVDGALRQMHLQHEEHGPFLADLFAALQGLKQSPSDKSARERVRLAAAKLAAEFGRHLEIEETVIFPAVRTLLSPESRLRMLEAFRERRRRNI